MNRKLMIIAFLTFTFILSAITFEAYAYDSGKAKRSHGKSKKKFFQKAHFVLKNEEELGLSDKQAEQIKNLKIKTKKDLIRKKAEIDILAIDIKAEMRKDPINTNAINKLIDKKYGLKKDKAKALVSAYAALKNTLTAEQKTKLKDLLKKHKKKMAQHSTMMCPMKSKKR